MSSARRETVQVPGPPPVPLVGWRGNAYRFARDRLGYMLMLRRRYGDLAALVRGGNDSQLFLIPGCPATVFGFGPRYNQEILVNNPAFQRAEQVFPDDSPLRRLATGLMNMSGDKHKQQRRLMMPAFLKSRLDSYHADMIGIAERIMARWRPGERHDLARAMQQLTLCVACKAFFNLDVAPQAESLGTLIHRWLHLVRSPAVFLCPRDWPLLPYRRFMRVSRRLERALSRMIEGKRAGGADEGDVLSVLIAARDADGTRMTENELVGNANLLFVAGHETTANGLTWTLFLLAQHPQVMADLYDELHGRLGGAAPTAEQLQELPLLDRVVKESLRILPPGPMTGRVAAEPTTLGGYDIPRHTEIIYSQYVTHHMPEVWAEPERFWPDRWLTADPSPYEYLPFGTGPRMCLGATFALLEMKTVLALLLQRWRFQTAPASRIDRQVTVTLSPKYGLPTVVHTQDRRFFDSPAQVRGNIHEMVDLSAASGSARAQARLRA
jgi:cytochrome P450